MGRTVRAQLRLFAVAVPLNLAWEVAQMRAYAFPRQGLLADIVGCLVPSFGDGLMTLAVYWTGWLVFRRADWVARPALAGYALMTAAGFAPAVAVEWNALRRTGAWAYAPAMPLMPGLGVGWLPVLQMLVLPPLTAHLVWRWSPRSVGAPSGGERGSA
jgi:hypothetical protein